MKNSRRLLLMLVAIALTVAASSVGAQMMGPHTGPMMHGGGMRSMHVLMAWMSGTELKATPAGPEPSLDSGMRSLGERLYGDHCAVCHGAKGDGNGPRAADLSPSPRDFTKASYKFRSTPSRTLPTDEDLWKVISNGLHGTAMVPWIGLSENERWALVAYIEGFSPRFASEARGDPVTVPQTPPETRELVEQGMKLYKDDCANCHGAKGQGDGAAMRDVGAGRGPRDFTSGLFKRGSDLRDIYLTLRTGLDGTPMLSFAKALSPEQSWAVAAYVRTLIARPSRRAGMMGPMMGGGGANQQERLGMMIDMPGMGGMHMGGTQ